MKIIITKTMKGEIRVAIYTIGDLHLSFSNPKPMNIFGENWNNHEEKIKNDYTKELSPYTIRLTYRKQSSTSWLKPIYSGPGIASACIAPALWVKQGTERKRTRAPTLN